MLESDHLHLLRDWNALGAMFSTRASADEVDPEQILLRTARFLHCDPSLFQLALTWLVLYGDYVATHRLARMILDDLDRDHRPALGLLLDTAQTHRRDRRFGKAIEACTAGPEIDARPLFDVDRRNAFVAGLAKENATNLSKKWGRWHEAIDIKPNGIRPASWVAAHNPHLRLRALCAGDVCASIIAEAIARGGELMFAYESEIAKAFVASRGAVREALGTLELSGIVTNSSPGTSDAIRITVRSRVMGKFRTTSYTDHERYDARHRFEHWYRDNSVYFVTSKVRDGYHAFTSEDAKQIFWDRFTHWTARHDFEPWVVSLLGNHYHILGYLKVGTNLGSMMQKLHGSVSKLVNDILPERHLPFWRHAGNQDYFDGCLRNEKQLRRTFPYVLNQAVRAGLVSRWKEYPHTKRYITFDDALQRAHERNVYLPNISYPRYDTKH